MNNYSLEDWNEKNYPFVAKKQNNKYYLYYYRKGFANPIFFSIVNSIENLYKNWSIDWDEVISDFIKQTTLEL